VVRRATTDVELAEVRIAAGTLVIVNTAAANRDPAVYPDPDRFDITRDAVPAMLTFGGGAHYCLGAHLARTELTQALTIMAVDRHQRAGAPAGRIHGRRPSRRSRYDRPSGS
jgi:cytochrome P450